MDKATIGDRASGILFHPTSLPGPFGIGDLGPEAYAWVDFVRSSRTRLWQVLPLGPTGYGDSPYQCFSSFAGNPLLISPTRLVEHGFLTAGDTADPPDFPTGKVDYGWVIPWKFDLLDRAFDRFRESPPPGRAGEFAAFEEEERFWLDDFGLFMAIKESRGGGPWTEWDRPLRTRDPEALAEAARALASDIERHKFRQYLFFLQWRELKAHADAAGIAVIGDIPIFVAPDSSDVWGNPDLFHLDGEGRPSVVAGVPPDYFSETGQLWGNPQYDWERHAATGYGWWIKRIAAVLEMVDIVRIDHFRAFADYWEIPAGSETAETGRWLEGPGAPFFEAVRAALGDLPIIAEDLGELSPKVPELRDRFDLPGMKILQFAFDDDMTNDFLPHNYDKPCVAYTGTHDNDTTIGWWRQAPEHERSFAVDYLDLDPDGDIARQFIEAVWASPAMFAIAPLQDFLSLGPEARMNTPGTTGGSWQWRIRHGEVDDALAARIADLNQRHDR
jgi:4-alpha-glucanotransferase